MKRVYLGIDIGGTNTKIGIISKSGVVFSKTSIKTDSGQSLRSFVKNLKKTVVHLSENQKEEFEIISIGVGAPNANPISGMIENPPNLGWGVENLVEIFSEEFNTPVFLENDANISALGEKMFGHAKGLDDFMVITLGTGVGVGTFIGGKLYSGVHGIGSEAGHMYAGNEKRLCSCGGLDHLECYLSSKGIKQTVKELTGERLRFKEIKELYQGDSNKVKMAITKSADLLAHSLCSLSTFVLPQAFILSGGVSTLGEKFIMELSDFYLNKIYPPFKGKTRFLISEISSREGAILGAAALAIHQSNASSKGNND